MNNTSILIILLITIIIAGAIIIFIQYENSKRSKNSSEFTNEQHRSAVNKLEEARKEISELKAKLQNLNTEKESDNESHYKNEYDKICRENYNLEQKVANLINDKLYLEQKVKELKRDKDELNRIIEHGSGSKPPGTHIAENSTSNTPKTEAMEESITDDQQDSSQPSSQDPVSNEGVIDKNVLNKNLQIDSFKGITMYASFPRLAGSSVYFSDLSEKPAEDSYFELKVSNELEKATFKPTNFMKIRNYDEAMAAMRTEGPKPNVATAVLEIKSGEAHKEGKDWIIDNFATIKLA